jgi:HK97 family phage portal protein
VFNPTEQRSLTLQNLTPLAFDKVPFIGAREVDQKAALGLTAAYASVRLLADVVSSFPVDAYRRDNGIRRPYRPGGTKPSWMLTPIPDEPTYTINQLISETVVSLYTDGNAFLYAPRDERGEVLEVRVIDPRRVEIYREGREVRYKIHQGHGTPTAVFGQDTILHIPLIAMPGELRGINPIHQLRVTLSLGLTLEDYAGNFFRTGSTPTGIIEVPHDLTKEQGESLKTNWARHHAGQNMHTPGVLTGGATFKALTFRPEDAQLLSSRQFTTEEIARIFRIPPNLLQVTTPGAMSYNSVEQQNLAFVQYTLRPLVEMIERPLSTLILLPDAFVKFSMDSILRGTTKDRYDTYRVGLQEGWLNVNDIRKFEDFSPIESGDSYRMPLNEADAETAMLSTKVDIVAKLVQAGFSPADAARLVGIRVAHTGAAPVTVQQQNAAEDDSEKREVIQPIINVTVPTPEARTRRVERDESGNITAIVEE